MEYLAWLAAETHGDHPRTACPVLAALTRALNDYMPDSTRQGLRPYLSRMVGTADDGLSAWRAREIVGWVEHRVYPLVWYSPMAWARMAAARRMIRRADYFGAVQASADVMYRAGLVRPAHWEPVWALLDHLLPLSELDRPPFDGPPGDRPPVTKPPVRASLSARG